MGLLSSADLSSMAADLLSVRSDRAESITVRRGATTLGAQTVRIARMGNSVSQRQDVGVLEESSQQVVVLGAITLDIQKDDRFNDSAGRLYQVEFVRPNRSVATMAEAMVVE